jgi:hypothetical protein
VAQSPLKTNGTLSWPKYSPPFTEPEGAMYHVHKSPPSVRILSQLNPTNPYSIPLICFNITLCTPRSSVWSPNQNFVSFYHVLLEHRLLRPSRPNMSQSVYNLYSSSLCKILQPPVTASLLGPNIILTTLLSNTLHVCCFPNFRDKVHNHTEQKTLPPVIFKFSDNTRQDSIFFVPYALTLFLLFVVI